MRASRATGQLTTNPNAFRKFASRCPEGTIENSPAFQRWGDQRAGTSPEGTAEGGRRRVRSESVCEISGPKPLNKMNDPFRHLERLERELGELAFQLTQGPFRSIRRRRPLAASHQRLPLP